MDNLEPVLLDDDYSVSDDPDDDGDRFEELEFDEDELIPGLRGIYNDLKRQNQGVPEPAERQIPGENRWFMYIPGWAEGVVVGDGPQRHPALLPDLYGGIVPTEYAKLVLNLLIHMSLLFARD